MHPFFGGIDASHKLCVQPSAFLSHQLHGQLDTLQTEIQLLPH
jgi:hypothetical protein